MPTRSPLILTRHMDLQIVEQFVSIPYACAQRRPTLAHFLHGEPHGVERRKECTAAQQESAAHHHPQDVHQGNVRSDGHGLYNSTDCMYSTFHSG